MKFKKGDFIEWTWLISKKTDIGKVIYCGATNYTIEFANGKRFKPFCDWIEGSGRILTPEEIVLYKLLGKL